MGICELCKIERTNRRCMGFGCSKYLCDKCSEHHSCCPKCGCEEFEDAEPKEVGR